jgi:hypothetical protein
MFNRQLVGPAGQTIRLDDARQPQEASAGACTRMTEYQIQPNARRCSVSGRELRAGERFFSVLTEESGKFIRRDYAADAWTGPPHEAFSFWAGTIATPEGRRRPVIDDDMLLDCFSRLEGQTESSKINFRYVVALLLMRRRKLRLDETAREDGIEVLYFRCPRTGTRYRVINPALTEDETAAVQDEVFQALGWE